MADVIRAGIIGTDTSHVKAFTSAFHDPKAPGHVEGVRVVACYPSFSPDVEASRSRVEDYKKILANDFGVKVVGSIAEMLDLVDVFMIESVDGRRHLPEFRQVAPTGKPTFIDKPFTASLADAKEIVRLAREHKTPLFSASALRFDSNFQKVLQEKDRIGKILGCDAYGPATLEPTNPGLFWYGIHGVEILYTFMGRGCKQVRCTSTPDADLAVGVWQDGRIGTMRGIRKGRKEYGASVLAEKDFFNVGNNEKENIYAGLIREMARFFQTKQPPVPLEETLEMMAFIEAAWQSSQKNGQDVAIEL